VTLPITHHPTSSNNNSAIMRMFSAGAYESKRGVNSTATLRLVPDGPFADSSQSAVNVACDVKWIDENGVDRTADRNYIRTRNVIITVREGPLNDEEFAAERGWLSNTTDIGPASATPAAWLSVRDALVNATVRANAPIARMVGCVVTGEDVDTGLPVSVAAQSQLALTWPGYALPPRLVSYTFPMAPSALAEYWRKCNTDADCASAPAGGQCLCSLPAGCKPDTKICQ
jgi:hypothetical protein